MSRTPCFYLERYNQQTKQYEFYHPLVWNFKHTEREPAELFPYNGNHEMFSIVEETSGNFPHMMGIHYNLPENVCPEIKAEVENFTMEEFELTPNVRWFTYADMLIYLLKHPTVKNWDYDPHSEDPEERLLTKENPLTALKERVDAFMEVMDGWNWQEDYSLIRIVYWID